MSDLFNQAIAACPVVPVVTIRDLAHAAPATRALAAAGVTTMEITLRTPVALDAIRAAVAAAAGTSLLVGVGTVTTAAELEAALAAGATFAVSPGASPAVLAAGKAAGVPLLPGIATVTEALVARDAGYNLLKFFPANINGGPPALKAFADILPGLRFCPTGGVGLANLGDYLGLANVVAAGGSWLTAELSQPQPDFAALEQTAAAARDAAVKLAAR